MKIVAIIPARLGSSRFPGKPLAPLLGKTMIEHVYRRTAMSKSLLGVYVATCDEKIRDAVEGFGGKAVMTSNRHERAGDRVAEAIEGIEADVVVMVQGDEPMTRPDMIDEATAPFGNNPDISCVNLTTRIESMDEFNNPNTIKVAIDRTGNALYFSRRPIPYAVEANFAAITPYKQVCIIPFSRQALKTFSALKPTPLEIAESIDMLRFLEHGYPVRMVETRFNTHAVDTPEDLTRVEKLMTHDPLTESYSS
ncbi:MAG: 3-deoxy-manno-octulosonate cytidylyltransferase [Rhodospirillales bacterium RIFCSPLOWO2_12_FULL_58_28]|nr:MAG: 3-deoxy-manno-octulosonate cytidylyltransferase [Rhodospirillales bacterium RIFCSPLOWO2_02_FULL_58_16]OHC76725.1 MAG: 3-deoxy-manno-octulosonate cytidylyltransferase [Rhodospirillales bacterium RIFCSPLOWO2_12_FULL_58_28]